MQLRLYKQQVNKTVYVATESQDHLVLRDAPDDDLVRPKHAVQAWL
jgi:hypothetical protein